MKKILIILLFKIAIGCVFAQNKTITGRIISDSFDPLSEVSLMTQDSVQIGKTNKNGFFEIEIPLSEKNILFATASVEPTTIQLLNDCTTVEVILFLSGSYDFMLVKKVNRIKKQKFRQLQKKHREAFEKGIFETEQPCYERNFIPFFEES
ncbi:hypothetical protein GOQ30_09925 [Flavobacterium sp. TP390]|uniref:Carboxypeptidase-like regulatory domain-containing protein n=1 Tax=Flavobacterium profundi TaxID=1774945 RepID=A0A6I4IIQ8_9FLAO|nr:hypothetical protein [Flavobacterium profundi]MVO09474.1 hypothetical protein [Flavobacterium profundi]